MYSLGSSVHVLLFFFLLCGRRHHWCSRKFSAQHCKSLNMYFSSIHPYKFYSNINKVRARVSELVRYRAITNHVYGIKEWKITSKLKIKRKIKSNRTKANMCECVCAEVSATMAMCTRSQHTCTPRTNTINMGDQTDRPTQRNERNGMCGCKGNAKREGKKEWKTGERLFHFVVDLKFPSHMHALTAWTNNIKSFNIYFHLLLALSLFLCMCTDTKA